MPEASDQRRIPESEEDKLKDASGQGEQNAQAKSDPKPSPHKAHGDPVLDDIAKSPGQNSEPSQLVVHDYGAES